MARYAFYLILAAGIGIRFWLQFLTPTFNIDEIALAFSIKGRDYIGLLYPLDEFQSSPPLYLFLQKTLFGLIKPFWISSKLLSFTISILTLFFSMKFAERFLQKDSSKFFFLLLFAFSPFIIYNSLTIKQYGIDLLFFLISVTYYERFGKSKWVLPFFIIWCLFSNIGCFYVAGYLIFEFLLHFAVKKGNLSSFFLQKNALNLKVLLCPLPYVLYFFWYMQQNGAEEIKDFMQLFWRDAFIPINAGFFRYMAVFFHGISVYFISSVHAIGYPGLILLATGFFLLIKAKDMALKNSIFFGISGILVHATMSMLKIYPLSERLYLYLGPLVLLLLILPFDRIKTNKIASIAMAAFFISMAVSYTFYVKAIDNDVISLHRYMKDNGQKNVYCSPRAYRDINNFHVFTDKYFDDGLTYRIADGETIFQKGLFVSRAPEKFGHEQKQSDDDKDTRLLLKKGKLSYIGKVDGYKIYSVKSN